MQAKELASANIPVVTLTDSVVQVLEHMTRLKVSHLPVVSQSDYLGLVLEKDLTAVADPHACLDSKDVHLLSLSVLETQHFFEIIDLVSSYELTLVPVLTKERQYAGCITMQSIVKHLSDLVAAGQPGAILELDLSLQDYSPTLISRIVEDNNAKIINLLASSNPDGRTLMVTIKVNTEETSSIIRSFDRYGLSVRSSYLANSKLDDFYRSRFEEFMKYMNM